MSKAKQDFERMIRLSHFTIERASPSIFWVDATSRVVRVNEAACKNLGYSRDEFVGKMVPDFDVDIPPEEWGAFWTSLKQVQSRTFNSHQRTKDGRIFPVEVSAHFIEFEGSEYCCAFSHDISERIAERQELIESKLMYEELASRLPETVYEVDEFGQITFLNSSGYESFGYTKDDLKSGFNISRLFAPRDRKRAEEEIRQLLGGKEGSVSEYEVLRKDGTTFPVLAHSSAIVRRDKVSGVRGIAVDITERKKREEELHRLATAVEQVDEAIIMSDGKGIVQYVNPAFERICGYRREEVIGKSMNLLIGDKSDAEFLERIWETLSVGDVWRGHVVNKKKDGSRYETESTISPIRDEKGEIADNVVIHRDVTEQMRLEKQVRQTQKIEALGTLAGGIAHDFNNIVTPIIGYAELIIGGASGPVSDAQRHDLERIITAGKRAQEMVAQILTFARQGEEERQPIQIGPIVKETLKLMRASLPTTIEIRTTIDTEEDVVFADPTQIHQVILNLCTNAGHAMGEELGVLDVALDQVEVDTNMAAKHPDLRAGPHIRITVRDTGCGMPQTVLARAFEPFFTTKGPGEGTGMGLSVTHGIVKGHGGSIIVNSKPGHGTTFQVLLPKAENAQPAKEEKEEAIPGGEERILFVDDEEAIVELVQRFMENLGYHVSATTSSFEALEMFREEPDGFDLVITDLAMPKMTGLALISEIHRIRPDTPTILCSGFSDPATVGKAKEMGVHELLVKPLTARKLCKAARLALG